MNLPREYISYSQIRLYQNCPKKYYYSYVKNLKAPMNDKLFLGVVFHATVEHYLKQKIGGKELEKKELIEWFNKKFQTGEEKQNIIWLSPADASRKRGVAFIHHFLREIATDVNPMMVEKELVSELPDLGVKLKGVIDMVETDFSITDFKTTTAKWSKNRVQESYLQMQIYRYLFEKAFGDVVTYLRFRIIYSRKSTNIKDQKVSVRASDLDTTKMFDIIKYVVENIRNEVFYKNESYMCGYCEYKDICRSQNIESIESIGQEK